MKAGPQWIPRVSLIGCDRGEEGDTEGGRENEINGEPRGGQRSFDTRLAAFKNPTQQNATRPRQRTRTRGHTRSAGLTDEAHSLPPSHMADGARA